MPAEPLLLATPAVPAMFVAYLNATTLKGPFADLQQESIDTNGKVRSTIAASCADIVGRARTVLAPGIPFQADRMATWQRPHVH